MPEDDAIENRVGEVAARVAALPPASPRLLVAIAGPPASGKSTLADRVAARLTDEGHPALHVPMDGFHLDNAVLEARDLLPRKGAPETFDAAGFVHAMRRLSTEKAMILPAFDREADLAVAGRIAVGPEHRVAVVEGNYLCLNRPPWRDLAALWHLSVFLDTPPEVLRDRLLARWRAQGFSEEDALRRAERNDLPNARTVASSRLHATLTLPG